MQIDLHAPTEPTVAGRSKNPDVQALNGATISTLLDTALERCMDLMECFEVMRMQCGDGDADGVLLTHDTVIEHIGVITAANSRVGQAVKDVGDALPSPG